MTNDPDPGGSGSPTTTRERPDHGHHGLVTGSDRFRPDIEGLRAIAVLAVVAFHVEVPYFSGGYVGVDMFFVISGFLITGQMLRDRQGTGGFGFATFYARRVRRLLPIATIVILAVMAASSQVNSPIYHDEVAADGRSAALFYSNYRFADQALDYFQAGRAPSPFQHFWSLSVEEQFYFVWPALFTLALVGAAATLRARHRRLAILLGAITVLSFANSVALTASSQPKAFFWLTARAWELAIGALLAVGAGLLVRLPGRSRTLLGWLGLAAIGIAVVTYDSTTSFPGAAAALPVIGTALVIAAGTGGRTWLGSVLSLAPFRAGGRYSYSLYLWHWPVLILAAREYPTIATRWPRALAVVLVVAVPLTLASYHLVEHPIRSWGWLRARSGATLAMGAALVLASVLGTVVYAGSAGTDDLDAGRPSETTTAAVGEDMHVGEYVPSDARPTLDVAVSDRSATAPGGCEASEVCDYGSPDADTFIVVFGDSHTQHWSAAWDRVAREQDWHIRRIAVGACPSFLYPPTGSPNLDCGRWREEAIQSIRDDPPDLVVLSNRTTPAYDRDRDTWEQGIRGIIAEITPTSPVAVMTENPAAEEDVPLCLADNVDAVRRCEPERPAADLDELNRELAAIVESEGATVIDVGPWLCTAERCPVVTADIVVYRDAHHITREFASSRAAVLAGTLEELLG